MDAPYEITNRDIPSHEGTSPDPITPRPDVLNDETAEPAWALFGALALRDLDLTVHSMRGTLVATALAQGTGLAIDRQTFWGFLLHDVGTLEIPSELLGSPRTLTAEERGMVATHAIRSSELIGRINGLEDAARIARHHHERWDGDGYPDGLTGHEIPFPARVLTVADAFAAMTAPRPHRDAYTPLEAMEGIYSGRGTQFDPGLSRALAALLPVMSEDVIRPVRDADRRVGERMMVHAERAKSLSSAQLEALFAGALGVPAAEAADMLGRSLGTQRTWAASLRRSLAVPPRTSLTRFLVTTGREVFLSLLPQEAALAHALGAS